MIELKINNGLVSLDDEAAIAQQVNRRKAEGLPVCVTLLLEEAGVDMILSTPQCAGSLGGSRRPNERERRLFDIWERHGLNQEDFSGGNLIAFLHHAHGFLS